MDANIVRTEMRLTSDYFGGNFKVGGDTSCVLFRSKNLRLKRLN